MRSAFGCLTWIFQGEDLEGPIERKKAKRLEFLRWFISAEDLGSSLPVVEKKGAKKPGLVKWLLQSESLDEGKLPSSSLKREGFFRWLFKKETL